MKLSPWLRRSLYASLGALWATGAIWFWLERFGEQPGEYGAEPHPWLPALLAAHGAVAFLALLVLGALWVAHVQRGWRARRNRLSGSGLVAALAVLIGTGWGLYYAGAETVRSFEAAVHLYLGLALPVLIALHVISGKRRR